jgi:hypothetical protein
VEPGPWTRRIGQRVIEQEAVDLEATPARRVATVARQRTVNGVRIAPGCGDSTASTTPASAEPASL